LELSTEEIEFNEKDQHIRCLAHVINLSAQEALKSLKSAADKNENELLNEKNNQVALGPLNKVSLIFNINFSNHIIYIFFKIKYYFLASYSYCQNKSFTPIT